MEAISPYWQLALVPGVFVLVLTALSYLGFNIKGLSPSTSKNSRDFRLAYEAINNAQERKGALYEKSTDTSLKIGELWIYPVKSLRGIRVPSALITPEGFYLDRRYMLLKVGDESPPTPKSLHISHHPEMALFQLSIPTSTSGLFRVTYKHPDSDLRDSIDLPFEPNEAELRSSSRVAVDMYGSACSAYDMGARYNDWFSTRFGFRVILAFWGDNPRPVLGNLPNRPAGDVPKPRTALQQKIDRTPILGFFFGSKNKVRIAFNDMASFLVISDASVRNVSQRIEQPMDASKFRPNIIIAGSATAFEEDYWAELSINPNSVIKDKTTIALTANCVRCPSLNVDYATGKIAKGKAGEVLKSLQKDRRVDRGMKYSPVFGRYGFPGVNDTGKVVKVGDEVVVSKVNEERTTFVWRGITTS